MTRHYDVVVIGASLGALACAALLARRGWRVLIVGHGHTNAFYTYNEIPCARRAFTLLSASSPLFVRLLDELAQAQAFRRRTRALDPMFAALLPGRRIALPADPARLLQEIEREYPEARSVFDDFYATLATVNASVDAAFRRDVSWSPSGFFERRATARAIAELPYRDALSHDWLAELPQAHPLRDLLAASAQFASDLGGSLPPLAQARLHGSWVRGMVDLAHGETELSSFLLERARAHGAEVRLHDRIESVQVKGSRVAAVTLGGEEEPTGAGFIVTDRTTRELLDLAAEFDLSRAAEIEMPVVSATAWRFVVSLVVRDAGIPASLATESFLLDPGPQGAIHLQRTHPPGCPPGHEVLVAEALSRAEEPAPGLRRAILSTVEKFLPFVERHYAFVDSPHDGLPAADYRSGAAVAVERGRLRAGGGFVEPEPMMPQLDVSPSPAFVLTGEPLHTPLRGAYLVGRSALPALGQEGQLLAAWNAARTITRTDPAKEQMRREMWSKLDSV